MNRIDLDGRAAVITGGAQGLGFAAARRALESGARVCLWDRDAAMLGKALTALGGRVDTVVAEVADEASVAAAAETTRRRLGRIDILVNNAGITGPNRKTWEYPLADWRRVLDVDLTGPYLCARAVLPGMIAAKYGRIVNVASIAGKEGNPNAAAYSAAKGGLIALTKSLGKELAGTGVLANCVTPAAAKTAIFEQMSEEHIKYMLAKIPMGRFVQPEEVAALIVWLCSEDCSFSTGAVFDISGGRATY